MANLGDEIGNCGLFLEQRRRHIFCSGKLSTQQPERARILPAKFTFSIFWIARRRAPIKASTLNKG
jgi:hypothetical protein